MSTVLSIAMAVLVTAQAQSARPDSAAPASPREPDASWKPLARSLWFDPARKQVIIRARVVLREGPLEHLMCLKGTKEHEAILATDAPARQIHAGLLLTGAEEGHPVRFLPKFEPPAGSPIAIELQFNEGGKPKTVDARKWLRDAKDRKYLPENWVFAGSEVYTDPITKQKMYAADEGDLITVANFGSAILDLPIASSASNEERLFLADTARIPPLGTEVFVFLRPAKGRPDEKPR
ncbi:YdjY domain-containing protein [Aquisphaera insulae]|uniref:YdjY domain-containing protein n=1 Tax=Aquisphaera insulae TaxID=2712864 RepID=UPI0013ED3BEA|nr:YdjY domain-containing protein [Aquisphaera insulae]